MHILIFDGTSVIYVCAIITLILIWVVIIGKRQIWRHRHNVARVRPQVALGSRISSKKAVLLRETQLDNVMRLRCENQARLTDCVSLQFRQSYSECCTLSDLYRTCSPKFTTA